MVIALNILDEITGNGGTIDVNGIEAMWSSGSTDFAAKNQAADELVKHAIHCQISGMFVGFCDENEIWRAAHRGIHAVAHRIEDHAQRARESRCGLQPLKCIERAIR